LATPLQRLPPPPYTSPWRQYQRRTSHPWRHIGTPSGQHDDSACWLNRQMKILVQLNQLAGPARLTTRSSGIIYILIKTPLYKLHRSTFNFLCCTPSCLTHVNSIAAYSTLLFLCVSGVCAVRDFVILSPYLIRLINSVCTTHREEQHWPVMQIPLTDRDEWWLVQKCFRISNVLQEKNVIAIPIIACIEK
jgi:hypothetical protein